MRGPQILFEGDGEALALLRAEEVAALGRGPGGSGGGGDAVDGATFLGLLGSSEQPTPLFGVDLPRSETDDVGDSGGRRCFADTRTSLPLLPALDLELALYATARAACWLRPPVLPSLRVGIECGSWMCRLDQHGRAGRG